MAAVVGGGLAAASLVTSALCAAALTGGRGEQDTSAAALHRLMFAAGGPVHGAGFGAVVGALGLAGLRTGDLPRPLAIAGLASATAGLLSPLYFVTERAVWFIPAGRFSGLLAAASLGSYCRTFELLEGQRRRRREPRSYRPMRPGLYSFPRIYIPGSSVNRGNPPLLSGTWSG